MDYVNTALDGAAREKNGGVRYRFVIDIAGSPGSAA